MRVPKYSNDDLKGAIALVKSSSSVNNAAISFNLPESSLRRKISVGEDTIKNDKFTGILTQEEEMHLYEWIVSCAEAGHPRSARQIIAEAQKIAEKFPRPRQFPLGSPSRHWLARFLKRCGTLKRTKCVNISLVTSTVTESATKKRV